MSLQRGSKEEAVPSLVHTRPSAEHGKRRACELNFCAFPTPPCVPVAEMCRVGHCKQAASLFRVLRFGAGGRGRITPPVTVRHHLLRSAADRSTRPFAWNGCAQAEQGVPPSLARATIPCCAVHTEHGSALLALPVHHTPVSLLWLRTGWRA